MRRYPLRHRSVFGNAEVQRARDPSATKHQRTSQSLSEAGADSGYPTPDRSKRPPKKLIRRLLRGVHDEGRLDLPQAEVPDDPRKRHEHDEQASEGKRQACFNEHPPIRGGEGTEPTKVAHGLTTIFAVERDVIEDGIGTCWNSVQHQVIVRGFSLEIEALRRSIAIQ